MFTYRLFLKITIFLLISKSSFSQEDSTQIAQHAGKGSPWSAHFQTTFVSQKHLAFRSLYRGTNSLADTLEPAAKSLTATLYLGRRLWKGAAVYVNPEIAGGKGLSYALGVAGALNGETYRVGEVAPRIFLARAYLEQHFPIGNTDYVYTEDEDNQVASRVPVNRFTIRAGKFAIADYYDHNRYSNDPRTQFLNWSIWANGAWDYPANTQGYTSGVVLEYANPRWEFRISTVAVPRLANYHLMEYNSHAHSETVELEHKYAISQRQGAVLLTLSHTSSQAPSYASGIEAISARDTALLNAFTGVVEHKKYGGKKNGVFLNIKQDISNDIGAFARLGWNDGKYATWAFTEIDQTATAGVTINGKRWKRREDAAGLALALNGISKPHREFLNAGGYGFIIGDGKLNYGKEFIMETFYNARITRFFWLTFDYQFVQNPGYNKDRGPVHAFALRGHVHI